MDSVPRLGKMSGMDSTPGTVVPILPPMTVNSDTSRRSHALVRVPFKVGPN